MFEQLIDLGSAADEPAIDRANRGAGAIEGSSGGGAGAADGGARHRSEGRRGGKRCARRTAWTWRGGGGGSGPARFTGPRGGKHLGLAKALVHEMPHTLAALEQGALSEWRATILVRESACLDVEDRRRLDEEICGDIGGLDGLGTPRWPGRPRRSPTGWIRMRWWTAPPERRTTAWSPSVRRRTR